MTFWSVRKLMTSWQRTLMQSNDSWNALRHLQQQWLRQHHLLQRSQILWGTQPTSIFQNSIWQSFWGNYMEWTSFIDLFKGAVIENSSLQGNQKLQYPKTSVKCDATKLQASIPVTDYNFDIAMNTLINSYENKRIIIRTHCIQSFCIDHWQWIMTET